MTLKTCDFVAWMKEQVPPPEPGDLIALRNHPLLVYARLHKRRESIMPPTDIDPTTERDLAETDDHDINVDDANRASEHADAERFDEAKDSPDDPIGGNGRPLTDADTARDLIASEVRMGATALDPDILRIAGITIGDGARIGSDDGSQPLDLADARMLIEPLDATAHIPAMEHAWHHAKALGKSEREGWGDALKAALTSMGLLS